MSTYFVRKFDKQGRIHIPKEIRDGIFYGKECNQKSMNIWVSENRIILTEHIEVNENYCAWRDDVDTFKARSSCGACMDTENREIEFMKYCPFGGKRIKLIIT